MSEYTDEFLNDGMFWRPILECQMYTIDSDIDMDDVVRANLWLDMQDRINKVMTPKPQVKHGL